MVSGLNLVISPGIAMIDPGWFDTETFTPVSPRIVMTASSWQWSLSEISESDGIIKSAQLSVGESGVSASLLVTLSVELLQLLLSAPIFNAPKWERLQSSKIDIMLYCSSILKFHCSFRFHSSYKASLILYSCHKSPTPTEIILT